MNNNVKKKAQLEKPPVLIPEKILRQMRFNKNFANVYTPYHEFENVDEDLPGKKRRRQERKEAIAARDAEKVRLEKLQQEQRDQVVVGEPWLAEKTEEESQMVMQSLQTGPKSGEQQNAAGLGKKSKFSNRLAAKSTAPPAAQAEAKARMEKRANNKKAEQRYSKQNQKMVDKEDKERLRARVEPHSKLSADELNQPGATAQSFSKQERKKNRAAQPAAKVTQNAGSTSSQANYDKMKQSIYHESSMASFPQRAPSIPEQQQIVKDKHQYDEDEQSHGLGPKKTVQSLGKLNTKSALRHVELRRRQLQRNISNDDFEQGLLKLEFSEASIENLSLTRQAVLRRNLNNSRLKQYRGSNKTNASPLAGNIYFPDRLIATNVKNQIRPIQDINYRRHYRREVNMGDSRNSLHASQRKVAQKKQLRIQETNLTFFNGSLKQPSQLSEPLDLDLTFLESYYDKTEKPAADKQLHEPDQLRKPTVGLAQAQAPYVKKRTQQDTLKGNELDNQSNNFNSMIISGRYIDCGSQRRQREKRNKQTSQEVINRRVNNVRVRDDDSLLSERCRLLRSKGSVKSHSRSPPHLQQYKGHGTKVRFDSPFIRLSDLGNTYYPNIVNMQGHSYQRSSHASNMNNHTLSVFPQTSTSKLRTNQNSDRAHRPLASKLPRQGNNRASVPGKPVQRSAQGSLEDSPGIAPQSPLEITEIATPDVRGTQGTINKEPRVVSRVIQMPRNGKTEDKNGLNVRQHKKFKTQAKVEEQVPRQIVANENPSVESKQYGQDQRSSKIALRKESTVTEQSNDRQASNVKQLKEIYSNPLGSNRSGKHMQLSFPQPVLTITNEKYQKKFIVNPKVSHGALAFNDSKKNIQVSIKGPLLQVNPKRKSVAPSFVRKNRLMQKDAKGGLGRSLQEQRENSDVEAHALHETMRTSQNLYNKVEINAKDKKLISAQKVVDGRRGLLHQDRQDHGMDAHKNDKMGHTKTESMTVNQSPGKPMSKQQSILPMINGQAQRGSDLTGARTRKVRQAPRAGYAVANNLYLGAATLATLNHASQQTKKKSLKEVMRETTMLDGVHGDPNGVAKKESQASMAQTAHQLRKHVPTDDRLGYEAPANLRELPEYSSTQAKNMNSKTQMSFQRNQINKARVKRQKTLPDQTYVAHRTKEQSIVTTSLATMRQSSNGSVHAPAAPNEYTDRGAHSKRNKDYLYQMYKSNDRANESPARKMNVSNMSAKQRAHTNMEVSYQAMKQEWRRPAAKLKNKQAKDRIYLPQQMPDIMAANDQAKNYGIARSMERNHRDAYMRIKDHSLGSSIQDAGQIASSYTQQKHHNPKQNRMYYYNEGRDDVPLAGRPSELNTSANFAQNSRTHADNFISNAGGQNTYHPVRLSQMTDRSGKAVHQQSAGQRTIPEGHSQPQAAHRQQRSQLGAPDLINSGHNQIYYNESLRDQNHMSLPYLNDGKNSRQNQVNSNAYNPKVRGSLRVRGLAGNLIPPTEESRTLEVRPVTNPSQLQDMDDPPGSAQRNARPLPHQFSLVEHSDVVNRMNSDGSTISEIHHHVHHHYNHTHIHHHHNEAASAGHSSTNKAPVVVAGAAVPPPGLSSRHPNSQKQQRSSRISSPHDGLALASKES